MFVQSHPRLLSLRAAFSSSAAPCPCSSYLSTLPVNCRLPPSRYHVFRPRHPSPHVHRPNRRRLRPAAATSSAVHAPSDSEQPGLTPSTSSQSPSSSSSSSSSSSTSASASASTAGQGLAFANLDLKRLSVWAAALIAATLLRSFFPVMLGTFIVGYVANSIVQWVRRLSGDAVPRRAVVALFYVGVISAISGFSLLTVPTVVREGQYFVRTLQSENPYVIAANVMRRTLGDEVATKLETLVVFSIEAPTLEKAASAAVVPPAQKPVDLQSTTPAIPEIRKEAAVDVDSVWTPERSRRLGMLLRKSIGGYVAGTAALITKLLGTSTKIVVKAVLSLLFSFLIMWDLPVIVDGIRRLGSPKSRLRYAYRELAPFFTDFGSVLGKAFEAQSLIAVVNTTLTTAGLVILAIPGVGFLSVVTLVCSFIPVAGVFISTLPMLILALTEYGAAKALAVVLMVIIVHIVEAYVLNPQIYSAHLHLHPFLVLVVLYVAEHLYGIAGLLMAVPVSVYLLRYFVLGEMSGRVLKTSSEPVALNAISSDSVNL